MRTHKPSERGFSLIELALALAIIALIAGGVVKGRELMGNARIQNVASQIQQLEAAISGFETRYGALPGDLPNASLAFGSSGTMTNGNGDGIINTAEEAGRAFQMLGLSQLLSGQFDGAASEPGSCPTSSCPSTSVGGRLQFLLGPTPLGGGSFRALLSAGGQLSVLQLAELDRRLDDGKPNSGRFRLLSQQSNTCMSGGDWNMSSTETACATALLIQ